MVMMKGLMGRCLKNEATLERVRSKAEQTEDKLNQLRTRKTTMEKKFELLERERKELEQSIGEAKKALEGKEKEIKNLKDGLRQAKEVAVHKYRDSDALLSELGDSFLQGSTTPSIRSRRPIPTWTFQTLKWRIKLKRPSYPLLQMTRTTSLLKLTVKVKGNQPQFHPSQTRPISLS